MPNTGSATIVFLVFMIVFIIVMLTFIIKILFLVQKKQNGHAQKLLVVKSNYEMELSKAKMEIQEQIFKQISIEIHDNACQIVALARLGLGTLNLGNKEEAKDSILEISDILEKALDELRHLSRSINGDVILNGGLAKSIEAQVGYIRKGGKYDIQLEIVGESTIIHDKKEIILFRIVQEALNNIIKHATASDICISLQYTRQFLKLQIRDNGKGFDLNEQYSGTKSPNGIHNMQQRAKLIDSEFTINSQPNKGTQITITTPY